MKSQGTNANNNGISFEKFVKNILINEYGFKIMNYQCYQQNLICKDCDRYTSRLIVTNHPYESLVGPGIAEFFIIDSEKDIYMRIECKYQGGQGSTDEKIILPVLSSELSKEYRTMVICAGSGFRYKFIDYGKKKAEKNNLLDVLSLDEFSYWLETKYGKKIAFDNSDIVKKYLIPIQVKYKQKFQHLMLDFNF